MGKSKSVLHSILRKLEETGSCKAENTPGRSRKNTAREDRWIGNESKEDRFVTASIISKRANANLGIKISRHTISWKLNEINLNSRVTSTKPYISKKNKMSRLKFATEHVLWTEEQCNCVPFNNESKFNQFCCEGSFGAFLRINIRLSKDGDSSRGWPKGSLFDSYYTMMLGRTLLLSLYCHTLP